MSKTILKSLLSFFKFYSQHYGYALIQNKHSKAILIYLEYSQ